MKPVAGMLVLLVLAQPALAQWEPPHEVLQVRVKGEGDWQVTCQWQDRRGKTRSGEIRGRNRDWERLHVN